MLQLIIPWLPARRLPNTVGPGSIQRLDKDFNMANNNGDSATNEVTLHKMEKRIELERRGRQPEEIEELNLDNCRATQVTGLTDDYKNLVSLSLINVGLTTLKGFPNLTNLQRLELSDNRISGNLNLLHGCPKLNYLNLSGNKIATIETLEPLTELSELQNLDLFNCEVTNVENYREKVFDLLEGLIYLDGSDRDNQEADDEDDEGGEGEGEGLDSSDEEGEFHNGLDHDDSRALKQTYNGEDEGDEEDDYDLNDDEDDDDDDEDDDDDDDDDESDFNGEEVEGLGGVREEAEDEEEGLAAVAQPKGVKRKHYDEEEDGEEDGAEEEGEEEGEFGAPGIEEEVGLLDDVNDLDS